MLLTTECPCAHDQYYIYKPFRISEQSHCVTPRHCSQDTFHKQGPATCGVLSWTDEDLAATPLRSSGVGIHTACKIYTAAQRGKHTAALVGSQMLYVPQVLFSFVMVSIRPEHQLDMGPQFKRSNMRGSRGSRGSRGTRTSPIQNLQIRLKPVFSRVPTFLLLLCC